LSNVISDYERGLISKAQAATGCRAVWDTVSGLVGGEVLDLINQASLEYRGARGVEFALDPKTARGYLYRCGTAMINDVTLGGGQLFAVGDEEERIRCASNAFKYRANLYEKGELPDMEDE
jgi:hypothetical protein